MAKSIFKNRASAQLEIYRSTLIKIVLPYGASSKFLIRLLKIALPPETSEFSVSFSFFVF